MAGATFRTQYDITPDGKIVGRITAGQLEYVRSSADQIQVVLYHASFHFVSLPRQYGQVAGP
jgi:hypothetical protein